MALAVELQLPINALTQNHTSLGRLIERAVAGDTEAFEQIMIYSQQRVLAMTWRMLGNEADARDAAQEVFLRIFKYLKRYDQNRDFFAWVYSLTVNVCRDFASRAAKQGVQFSSLDDGLETFDLPSEQDNIYIEIQRTQQLDLIAMAIASLPQKEKAAIVLRDLEGFPTEEVADILRSSPTTVRSQISSARRKIKIYCDQYLNRKERRAL